ncbi:cytidylate kinase family protein [Candidatus Hakubella thermalkaliphila]|uniref:cytidylate kinase family protein n=1 Tax=Candidatus Hakubella thermalkaliphila TaxID=2754717 RepID=UPI003F68C387
MSSVRNIPVSFSSSPAYKLVYTKDRDYQEQRGAEMSVITVSRQWGSGGSALARKLAQTPGYRLIDKAELVERAQKHGVLPNLFEHVDEQTPSFPKRQYEEKAKTFSTLVSYCTLWAGLNISPPFPSSCEILILTSSSTSFGVPNGRA